MTQTIEWVTDDAGLTRLADEWQELWQTLPNREVFGCPAWTLAVWRARGAGAAPCVPVARAGGRLAGLLPLARWGRTLRFLGAPDADYNDVLCAPAAATTVVPALLEALLGRAGWEVCALDNLGAASSLRAVAGALPEPLRRRMTLVPAKTAADIDLRTRREEVLRELLEKKRPLQFQRKLEKLGRLELHHLEDRGEIRRHLPLFFRQHVQRWAMAGETSAFLQEPARRLFAAWADALDPAAELRFAALTLDGRPIAYHFGFETHGKFIFYKPTFDVAYWDYSVGTVLIRKLFEYIRDRPVHTFDLTIGGEEYKRRFANHEAAVCRGLFYARGPRAAARRWGDARVLRGRCDPWEALAARARRLRAAARRHGWAGLPGAVLRAGFRRFVYRRVEVCLYARDAGAAPADAPPPSGFEVRAAGWLDLLGAAGDEPHLLERLRAGRERLKRGDALYLARQDGALAHVAWKGARTELVAAYELGERCRIPLAAPAELIYDCWTPPAARGRGYYPATLRRLAQTPAPGHTAVWIYCLSDNAASRRGIEKAGFALRHRMWRVTWLGRWERCGTA